MSHPYGTPDHYTKGRTTHSKLPGPKKGLSSATGVSTPGSNELLFAIASREGVRLWHSPVAGSDFKLYYALQGDENRILVASSPDGWEYENLFLHTDPAFGSSVVYSLDVIVNGVSKTIGEARLDLAAYALNAPTITEEECTLNVNQVHLQWAWNDDQNELASFQIERLEDGVWIQIASTVALLWSGLISSAETTEQFRVRALGTRLAPSAYDTISLDDAANTGGGTPTDNRGDVDHHNWTPNLARNASFELTPNFAGWEQSGGCSIGTGGEWADRLQFAQIPAGEWLSQEIWMPQSSSDMMSFSFLVGPSAHSGGKLTLLDQDDNQLVSIGTVAGQTITLEAQRIPPTVWMVKIHFICSSGTLDIDAVQVNQGATVDAFDLHSHDRVSDVYSVLTEQGSAIIQNEDTIQLIVGDLSIDDMTDALSANFSFLNLVADEFELTNQTINATADALNTAVAQIAGGTSQITDADGTNYNSQIYLNTTAINDASTGLAAAHAGIAQNAAVLDGTDQSKQIWSSIDLNTSAILGTVDEINGSSTMISQLSNAASDDQGNLISLWSQVVLQAQIDVGGIAEVAAVRLGADFATGTNVTISADNIDLVGAVTVINDDPSDGSTRIDAGKLFADQAITVGINGRGGNQFIIDGQYGQIRNNANTFLIEPEASENVMKFGADGSLHSTYFTQAGNIRARYNNAATSNYREVEIENEGFVRHWKGTSEATKHLLSEWGGAYLGFFSDTTIPATLQSYLMGCRIDDDEIGFFYPNFDTIEGTLTVVGSQQRVKLDMAGLVFYDQSGAVTGSYPSTGIAGGGADTLVSLTDTNIVTPGDKQILEYDSATSKWVNVTPSAGNTTLNAMTDTNFSGLADNHMITYDSATSKWVNEAIPVPSLNALTNVTLTSPTNDQVLKYNSSLGKWVNGASPGGGGASALNDLSDVNANPSDGNILRFNNALGIWEESAFIQGVNTLAGMADTTITSPYYRQALLFDGAIWENRQVEFVDISGTSINNLAADQVLRYDGALWKNSKLFLNNLGDVQTTAPWPGTGDSLVYDGSNWVSKKPVEIEIDRTAFIDSNWQYNAAFKYWFTTRTITLSSKGVIVLNKYAAQDADGRLAVCAANPQNNDGTEYEIIWAIEDPTGSTTPTRSMGYTIQTIYEK